MIAIPIRRYQGVLAFLNIQRSAKNKPLSSIKATTKSKKLQFTSDYYEAKSSRKAPSDRISRFQFASL